MGYLVIKNGTNKKSYQCTNTCNKPRLRVGNSYIPITNSTKPTMRARVSGSYIADYKSYTYTANKGTITTGTTYLTRASTSNTVYKTWTRTYEGIYTLFATGVGYVTVRYVSKGININGVNGNTAPFRTLSCNEIDSLILSSGNKLIVNEVTAVTTVICKSPVNYATSSSWSTSPPNGEKISISTYSNVTITIDGTCTTISTTATVYQTRASTSGTSYGTKTTNKTLTSSSWG